MQKKATRDIITRAKSIGKVTDKLWSAASKTPMFSKGTHRKGPDGKERLMKKAARLIGARTVGAHALGTHVLAHLAPRPCGPCGPAHA